jgi:triosephosphate isomerase
MRKKIVAGNWKMNLTVSEGIALLNNIIDQAPALPPHQHIVFCTPFVHLFSANETINKKGVKNIALGAQNCHPKPNGAFTGEISLAMLSEVGVEFVLVGHSERREYFQESNSFLKEKVDAILSSGQQVIFCCGEALPIRESQTHNEFVAHQLAESLFHVSAEQFENQVIIAYEPIWAIGTGVTASSAQAQDMHAFIRSLVAKNYGASVAENTTILYGGSCNASNAAELFACADVDGGLIGGAALKAETFLPIIQAMP